MNTYITPAKFTLFIIMIYLVCVLLYMWFFVFVFKDDTFHFFIDRRHGNETISLASPDVLMIFSHASLLIYRKNGRFVT